MGDSPLQHQSPFIFVNHAFWLCIFIVQELTDPASKGQSWPSVAKLRILCSRQTIWSPPTLHLWNIWFFLPLTDLGVYDFVLFLLVPPKNI
jgi:hypothetical protein